jgi:hypothetical protein
MAFELNAAARRRSVRPWLVALVTLLTTVGSFALASADPAPPAGPTVTAVGAGAPAVAEAPASTSVTHPSWNRHVPCRATVTTLRAVLGTQRGRGGGATFAGGAFRPGIPDRRATPPPCKVNGKGMLVELHRVRIGFCTKINLDGDWGCTLRDKNAPASTPEALKSIHIEIDGQFIKRGWAPRFPPGGTEVNIQGFVFWDPGHTDRPWHFNTGWEIHPFTAWRLPG